MIRDSEKHKAPFSEDMVDVWWLQTRSHRCKHLKRRCLSWATGTAVSRARSWWAPQPGLLAFVSLFILGEHLGEAPAITSIGFCCLWKIRDIIHFIESRDCVLSYKHTFYCCFKARNYLSCSSSITILGPKLLAHFRVVCMLSFRLSFKQPWGWNRQVIVGVAFGSALRDVIQISAFFPWVVEGRNGHRQALAVVTQGHRTAKALSDFSVS